MISNKTIQNTLLTIALCFFLSACATQTKKVDSQMKSDVSKRVDRVGQELRDVTKAIKEVGNQIGDVPSAMKGNNRSGKKRSKK